jgi:NAD(P)-dependent dehydrogenase (short-subunit alcohol dehydrogenase family)
LRPATGAPQAAGLQIEESRMPEPDPAPLPTLASFAPGVRALVFGASGAIGAAFARALATHPRVAALHVAARDPAAALPASLQAQATAQLQAHAFDLTDEANVAATVAAASAAGPLDLVLVATGRLHAGPQLQPEKSWRSLTPEALAQAFALNATGPALIAKHSLERLSTGRKAAFAALSARVGSIEDNRLGGWHAYRASKAALHMLLRGCAIELARRNPAALCVALHPGTVDSALSRPFQSGVAPARLFTPDRSAAALLDVIDQRSVADSGRAWAWDGQPIPF